MFAVQLPTIYILMWEWLGMVGFCSFREICCHYQFSPFENEGIH